MIYSNIEEFASLTLHKGAFLAIDYGKKKIGIAISDVQQRMSLPIKVIENDIKLLPEIVKEYKIVAIVIGVPINMDGSYGESAVKVEQYAQKVSDFTKMAVYLQDERMTSKAAQIMLREAGMKRERRDQVDDSIAASLILNTVLESLTNLTAKS